MTAEQTALVLEHEPLVRKVAGSIHIHTGRTPREDLLQAGRLGLCEAALRWSASRGVPFGAFARQRIKGAIVDAMREGQPVSGTRRRGWGIAPVYQLSALVEDRQDFDVPDLDGEDLPRRAEGARVMAMAMALEPRQRAAVVGHAAGVPLIRVGAELGVCESRAQQLRDQGHAAIRARLGLAEVAG